MLNQGRVWLYNHDAAEDTYQRLRAFLARWLRANAG
jgi:hypothetical protein